MNLEKNDRLEKREKDLEIFRSQINARKLEVEKEIDH